MTISYKWLSQYLPEEIEPQKLSKILTSIGLEVESLEFFESVKGSLQGIIVGQVLEVTQHPNADKLRLAKVDTGNGKLLHIVCGAANLAPLQKVLVAPAGSTIYPIQGEPVTMKKARIRGEESEGMICAEDELGLGNNHDGIIVLPETIATGSNASDYFIPQTDWIYEIGLTPNRMDAMSHIGVAKDVCAYLSYHYKKDVRAKTPYPTQFKADNHKLLIKVIVENKIACKRYAGVSISGVEVKESPDWLKQRLLAIGQRPINNIVDITNFILHETGQPLHAFDADTIAGHQIIVKNLPEGETFQALDGKLKVLTSNDLMICNAEEGMCIAGVFGGAKSGVKEGTKNIFLESAWFNPMVIRKTSLYHGLRTEAASKFEKGVDISNLVPVLKRAALLIKEIAGGEISSDIVDVYPDQIDKTQVTLKYHYLKKLSGKNYHPDSVKRILLSLGFEVIKEGMDEIWVAAPYNKPDISLPADVVEEIVRIDGLDNIEIKGAMTITPSGDENILKEKLKDKIGDYLTGSGFYEIVTNSITNSAYYTADQLTHTVKMINNLSAELNVMRPSMIETGLEAVEYNLNRKNKDLLFFEFGKTYHVAGVGNYIEKEHLALYLTGEFLAGNWNRKANNVDFFFTKGLATAIFQLCGIEDLSFTDHSSRQFTLAVQAMSRNKPVATAGEIDGQILKTFNIKQPVFYIEIDWAALLHLVGDKKITYKEVPKFPAVIRDLSVVVNSSVAFEAVENIVSKAQLASLKDMKLFDIFESEKLGPGKKAFAISFTFMDEEKTFTDKEIDGFMSGLIQRFENELNAEIRR